MSFVHIQTTYLLQIIKDSKGETSSWTTENSCTMTALYNLNNRFQLQNIKIQFEAI